ncbi:siderophore-interacting protein [Spelaeicoccus albus]|uniref:NADPH-dependent ferric siderophore reductase n=1 Tax=Spelaeicoccus albus TaxID=1280376 RepID=A0A7Z0ABN3_9MICO|nr:siderophore-interacting protein [Spelaeicoccus albus]NYI67216.1 NADPH-dependent ferric siderophore reductase [Spelaeicoccus albus]
MTMLRKALRETARSHSMSHYDVAFESARLVTTNFMRVRLTSDNFDQQRPIAPADAFKLGLIPRHESNVITRVFRMRALTVRRFNASAATLDFDVVLHPGLIKEWLGRTERGDVVTLYGFRHEWAQDNCLSHAVFIGDSSSMPAIAAIVESLPDEWTATVLAAVPPGDRSLLSLRDGVDVHWTESDAELLPLMRELPVPAVRCNVWIAAEAGVTRELRHHATSAWGVARDDLHAAAYWKR